jgi:hypothetical protein
MRYTYSDDDYGSDGVSSRRSARESGISTPMETGPTVTASGRQVKSRVGGMYGESILVDQRKELERIAGEGHFTETSEDMPTTMPNGRGMRTSRSGREVKPPRLRYGDDAVSDESDEAQSSGKEWSGDENEPDESEPDFDDEEEEEDEDMDGDADDIEDENTQESLVVQLRYRKGAQQMPALTNLNSTTPIQPRPQPKLQLQPRPTVQHAQQVMNGNSTAIAMNGSRPVESASQVQIPEQAMGDTIDVAPRIKLPVGNETNGTAPTPPRYHVPLAPRSVVEIPVQAMDVS